jgi:hypothetical protein
MQHLNIIIRLYFVGNSPLKSGSDFLRSSGSGTGSTQPREYNWPPPWSTGQSSWLQIQRPGFDSRHCQIFWEVVGLERGPLSLANTTEELLGRKSNGSGQEIREYCRRDPSRWPPCGLYLQKLAVTSPTSGGHWVGIVLSRTQVTEFVCLFVCHEMTRPPQYLSHCLQYLSAIWFQRGRWRKGALGVGWGGVGSPTRCVLTICCVVPE